MATRTAVCHGFAIVTVGMLLLLAPTALEAQEQRSVTVGAAIVECPNRQALDTAMRLLADRPIALLKLEAVVVEDTPLVNVTVRVRPLEQRPSIDADAEIVATIHFPRN